MVNPLSDDRVSFIGSQYSSSMNRKMCFQARDLLADCTDSQPNGNKMRCPDELYAYEMWCPSDFRNVTQKNRRREEFDRQNYDADYIANLNRRKQTVHISNYSQPL